MGELKSAYERAMERAERLGKLSPDEMREMREKEYSPIGSALADRYLEHGHLGIFTKEVGKYMGEEGDIVRRAASLRLVERIGLDAPNTSRKAIEGIIALRGDEGIGVMERISSLINDYQEENRRKYDSQREEVERRVKEVLHQLRISGSAIGGVNVQQSQAWEEVSRELGSHFSPTLEALKGELLDSLAKP